MRKLAEKEVKALCQAADYDNGEAYFQQGKVADTWQTETSLHASVAGSGQRPYRVSVTAEGDKLTPKCTCPAHRRRPFCKHVAAVLVAWVRAPGRFVAGEAPPAAPQPKPQSQARRSPKAKLDRRQVQLEGLAKVEALLMELTNYGLLSLSEAQVARVADLAHTAESHKLRRLARLVTRLGLMLETARTSQGQVDEAAYAELLSDAWLTTQATRRALEDPQADPTTLEELVGKTWREKDLDRLEGVRLLELAYETVELDTGFTVDTSYLLSLDDGALYTEKQIVPTRLKNQARKPSYTGLLAGAIGLYPGPEPRRIKLIEMASEAPLADADWQQALAHAEQSVAALFQRCQATTANPLATPEAYALFAPAQILVDGPAVSLLDGEGQAIPLTEGGRVVGHLTRQPIAAVFGQLALTAGALQLAPLGLITLPPETRLLRLAIA
jgi:hypothetical protein